MMKDLIDTKSSAMGKYEKHKKKCDWGYDDEYDQEESIMNEQSEEGTAPDYDSVLDNTEQVIQAN